MQLIGDRREVDEAEVELAWGSEEPRKKAGAMSRSWVHC
jgi:hypothetical protein